jgi:hypothetical protein
MATKQRLIEVLTTAMEKPNIANALIQRVINELKKEWVGLTDDEIIDTANNAPFDTMVSAEDYVYVIARSIETKLKEKNNG